MHSFKIHILLSFLFSFLIGVLIFFTVYNVGNKNYTTSAIVGGCTFIVFLIIFLLVVVFLNKKQIKEARLEEERLMATAEKIYSETPLKKKKIYKAPTLLRMPTDAYDDYDDEFEDEFEDDLYMENEKLEKINEILNSGKIKTRDAFLRLKAIRNQIERKTFTLRLKKQNNNF